MTASATYDSSAIEVLEGLEPVRRRPGMYTDTTHPNHLAAEVIDNAVDEALSGHASAIEVTIEGPGTIEVSDNGRGLPVDVHPVHGVPAIELILTRLHAGGKFGHESYGYAGGLHGVGVSVVNALSSQLEARVRRGGQVWAISYAGGCCTQALHVIGTCPRRQTGTSIRFTADPAYFDSPAFDLPALRMLLQAKAVLCPGLRITYCDRLHGEQEVYVHEGSLADYLSGHGSGRERLPVPPFASEVRGEDHELSCAVCWESGTEAPSCRESFVNLIPTPEGGTHVSGLRQGLFVAVREFCELHGLLPRQLRLSADDVWERCSYVLAVKIREPQFQGQTKQKLSSRQCATLVEGIIRDRLSLYLSANVEAGRQLADLVIAAARARVSRARVVERKKLSRGPQLPGKLVDCTSTDPGLGELFIVEGDSAGGSARQARDASFQAILPLRGKILNTWEVSAQTALSSEEIRAISVAVGLEIGSDDLSELRYGKICILADADADGLHIGTLLCALFVRHFRRLVECGHVFVACPPLYRLDSGRYKEYALDDEELEAKRRLLLRRGVRRDSIRIQRFKGLGEMNPEQLRETTLAPQSRRLMQLTLSAGEGEAAWALLDMLLSKKRASDRRAWLERNGDRAEFD